MRSRLASMLLTSTALLTATLAAPAPASAQGVAAIRNPQPDRFWRFYSVAEPPAGAVPFGGPCADPPLPPAVAAMQLDIQSAPLFAPGLAVPAPDGDVIYCQHTAAINNAQRAEIAALDTDADLELVPPRVLPQSVPADRVRVAGQANLIALAGLPAVRGVVTHPTTVAVLDTAAPADAPGLPGFGAHDSHGEDMALIVRQALCPDDSAPADCGIHVETLPALDLVRDDHGPLQVSGGGTYGDAGQIARAIHQAVDAAAVAGHRLVIDLSVAWAADDLDRPSNRAVRAAIEQARARGAIVVAAAGNDTVGCGEGPVLPAAWSETLYHDGAPLVLSAAAVTADGAPVSNARASGPVTTRAFGDGVTADPEYFAPGLGAPPDGSLRVGSSIAAAITAAAAAGRLARGDAPAATIDALTAIDDPAPGLPRPDLLRICTFLDLPCPPLATDSPRLDDVPADPPRPETDERPGGSCDDGGSHGSSPTCEVCFGVARDHKVYLAINGLAYDVWLRAQSGKSVRYVPLTDQLSLGQIGVYQVDLTPGETLEIVYYGGTAWHRAPVTLYD